KQPQGSWLGVSGEKLKATQVEEKKQLDAEEIHRKLLPGYERAQKAHQFVIGSPKTVTEKLQTIMKVLRPGSMVVSNVKGPISNQDRQKSMRLMGKEVAPAIREFAGTMGLVDAITRPPRQSKIQAGTKRAPVSDKGPLKELGLL